MDKSVCWTAKKDKTCIAVMLWWVEMKGNKTCLICWSNTERCVQRKLYCFYRDLPEKCGHVCWRRWKSGLHGWEGHHEAIAGGEQKWDARWLWRSISFYVETILWEVFGQCFSLAFAPTALPSTCLILNAMQNLIIYLHVFWLVIWAGKYIVFFWVFIKVLFQIGNLIVWQRRAATLFLVHYIVFKAYNFFKEWLEEG